MEPTAPAPAAGGAVAQPTAVAHRQLLPSALEFQSDAAEIEHRPLPKPARLTLYILLALIACGIAWAAVAHVDRIVVAHGKLITTAVTIVEQPLETSVVRSLDAKVGDIVRKGEPLATLDPTFSAADAAQLRSKVASLDAQIERLNAELQEQSYEPTALDEETRLQSAIWARHAEQYRAKIDSYDQQIRHAEAEIATKTADHAALVPRLAVARELEAMRSELMQKEFGSKVNYLDAKSQRMQIEREMQLAINNRIELEQDLKRARAEKAAYIAEFQQKVGEDLVQARRDRDSAAKQLEKAALRNAITVLTAPADAVVLEVAQRSVGSVMKEAEPLYTLVPLDSPLEAEVSIEGRDIGQVEGGALTRLKLDAWPFQKHGTLTGAVRTVTNDSFAPDNKKDGQQLFYKARVEITSTKLRNVPGSFRLIPGMAVTAEIKAGERTVLSYFLYPLLRGLDESIREP
jgi:HlyD family secretion protein